MVATRGGLWLAGADASDDVIVTQGPWTGAVDPVHRSTVDRSKGVRPLLIWAADLPSDGRGGMQVTGGGGQTARGGSGRRLAGMFTGDGQTGPSGHQSRRGRHKNEEEDKGDAPGSSEGRERHR
jgi:hypothetical protein